MKSSRSKLAALAAAARAFSATVMAKVREMSSAEETVAHANSYSRGHWMGFLHKRTYDDVGRVVGVLWNRSTYVRKTHGALRVPKAPLVAQHQLRTGKRGL